MHSPKELVPAVDTSVTVHLGPSAHCLAPHPTPNVSHMCRRTGYTTLYIYAHPSVYMYVYLRGTRLCPSPSPHLFPWALTMQTAGVMKSQQYLMMGHGR